MTCLSECNANVLVIQLSNVYKYMACFKWM